MTVEEVVAARLAAVGVHPAEADLSDIAAGFPTLLRWYDVLGETLEASSEPAVVFPPPGPADA
jgi:hypothetical protein